MARFVPKEKLSKKARKELNRQRRTMWDFSPVTKTVDSRKLYNRKTNARDRYDDYGGGVFYGSPQSEEIGGVIPHAPATEVRTDELQLRKCAQDIHNPVRIGTVKALVAGVYQNRKACRLTERKDAPADPGPAEE